MTSIAVIETVTVVDVSAPSVQVYPAQQEVVVVSSGAGIIGPQGPEGPAGIGLIAGGLAGQVLLKLSKM